MGQHAIPPVRSEGGLHDDYLETHPAFGVISASRVTSTGHTLFQSDVRHDSYVVLRVHHADRARGHHRDLLVERNQVVEVALSHDQFLSLFSTMNISPGVPCTITTVGGDRVPAIQETQNRFEVHLDEIRSKAANATSEVNRALNELSEALDSGRKTPIKDAHRHLAHAVANLPGNMEFVQKSLIDAAETVVEKVGHEITARQEQSLRTLGLQAYAAKNLRLQGHATASIEAPTDDPEVAAP